MRKHIKTALAVFVAMTVCFGLFACTSNDSSSVSSGSLNEALSAALEKTGDNYRYEFSVTRNGKAEEAQYARDGAKYEKFTAGEAGSFSYMYKPENGNSVAYVKSGNGFKALNETDAGFEEASASFMIVDFSDLDPSRYTRDGEVFLARSQYALEEAKAFAPSIGGEYVFMKIVLDGGFVGAAELNVTESGKTTVYCFNFYDYGKCSVKLPATEITDSYKRLDFGSKTPIETITEKKGVTRGLPSVGSPNVLVIPVEFTDARASSKMRSDLEKAFFGTSEQTGWESLSSYYYKSSYGKLNIGGTVTEVFNTGKPSSYYESLYANTDEYPEYRILKAALEYFDDKIDYSDYDFDGDGMIDAVYMVYTVGVDYESDDPLWWAFTNEYYTDTVETYDGKEADFYIFMGYDFFFEKTASGKQLTLNCETLIHESGHLLGIDDFYDYDENKGPAGGLGGGDMMDYNVGDHNPFTKLLLGWVNPYVVSSDGTLELGSFGSVGDCAIVFKDKESPFSEFFIIDYYTPDGLNAMEAGYSGLFDAAGIRVYHVDADLASSVNSIWEAFENNNSDTKYKLISLVEADGRNDIIGGGESSSSDLFAVGKTISGLKWNDGTADGFTVSIDGVTGGNARSLSFSFAKCGNA